MDRRAFLKTLTQAAAVAAVAGRSGPARAASPWKMTVAAVGDYIPGRRLSQLEDPGLLAVAELLRGADCTWANCETVLAEVGEAYPALKGFDPHLLSPPWGADELAWLGVDVVGTANNHTMDWGDRGLFSTLRHLDRAGIAHSGAGVDLARAAAPAYADTPAGRVGAVNCSVTFLDFFQASTAHPYVPGRPGLNPAKLDYKVQLPRDVFAGIKALAGEAIALSGWKRYEKEIFAVLGELPEDVTFFGDDTVIAGDRFDYLMEIRPADLTRITEAVAVARNNARAVIASTHAHEARQDLSRAEPAVEAMARATIDAGADLFVAAGPHILRGVEIYHGKPIFHSLGNFVFQYESTPGLPAEGYAAFGLPPDTIDRSRAGEKIFYYRYPEFWRALIPRVTLEGAATGPNEPQETKVTSIELFPITLGFGEPIYRRGIPTLAKGAEAEEILREVATLSEPYGTRITIRDGVGKVEL